MAWRHLEEANLRKRSLNVYSSQLTIRSDAGYCSLRGACSSRISKRSSMDLRRQTFGRPM